MVNQTMQAAAENILSSALAIQASLKALPLLVSVENFIFKQDLEERISVIKSECESIIDAATDDETGRINTAENGFFCDNYRAGGGRCAEFCGNNSCLFKLSQSVNLNSQS